MEIVLQESKTTVSNQKTYAMGDIFITDNYENGVIKNRYFDHKNGPIYFVHIANDNYIEKLKYFNPFYGGCVSLDNDEGAECFDRELTLEEIKNYYLSGNILYFDSDNWIIFNSLGKILPFAYSVGFNSKDYHLDKLLEYIKSHRWTVSYEEAEKFKEKFNESPTWNGLNVYLKPKLIKGWTEKDYYYFDVLIRPDSEAIEKAYNTKVNSFIPDDNVDLSILFNNVDLSKLFNTGYLDKYDILGIKQFRK